MIALRVKEARQRKGLPMGQLSEQTGISKGMLSKIENAQVSPSLATLARLAEALDTPLTAFFRGFDEERDAVFVKAGHGAEIRREGVAAGHHYQQLGTMRGQHRRMTPQLVTLTEQAEVFPLYQHPGTEFLYMLSGVDGLRPRPGGLRAGARRRPPVRRRDVARAGGADQAAVCR